MKKSVTVAGMLLALIVLTAVSMAQPVRINEAYSRGVAGDLDWVEITNTTSAPVDISNFKIYDSGGQAGTKPKKLFPDGSIIPAKGFLAIVVDTNLTADDKSGFGISSGGETVWLEDATGVLVDSIVIPAVGVDTSWGRVPDGADVWTKLTPRSKGLSNVWIKMNEIYSRGTAGNLDWIEIYNAWSGPMDISAYKIYDSGGQGGSKPKKPFPANTVIASKGFFVIVVDTASFDGDQSGFGLSSGGETVWLEDGTGLVIDQVAFPAMGVDSSWSRLPDASGIFVLQHTTRGATNGGTVAVEGEPVPEGFALEQNFPNPFNPSTTVRFTVGEPGLVSLTVCDMLGRQVASIVNRELQAGCYTMQFHAGQLPSGTYLLRLQVGASVAMRAMSLMK